MGWCCIIFNVIFPEENGDLVSYYLSEKAVLCLNFTLCFIWVDWYISNKKLKNCCVSPYLTSTLLICIVQCRTCYTHTCWPQKSISHLNCTVNNAYSSFNSNQGFVFFSVQYSIISLPLYTETIRNAVYSIEHELIMHHFVQTSCSVEYNSYRFNIYV